MDKGKGPASSPDLEGAEALWKEMEKADDDFFAKFLKINGVDPEDPAQIQEILSHQPELLSSSLSGNLEIPGGSAVPVEPGKKDDKLEATRAAKREKLMKLYLEDPERAKRMVANRLSALKSIEEIKNKKAMIQEKIDAVRTESKASHSRLEFVQKTSAALKAEREQLNGQAQAIQQQIQLMDSLNRGMMMEIEQLKRLNGLVPHGYPSSAPIGAPQIHGTDPPPKPFSDSESDEDSSESTI